MAPSKNIIVGIEAGCNKDNSTINYYGESRGIITQNERELFQLSDDAIREGILKSAAGDPADTCLDNPIRRLGNQYIEYYRELVTGQRAIVGPGMFSHIPELVSVVNDIRNDIQKSVIGDLADIFLYNPTGHLGNLYTTNCWEPVTTVLTPVGARIVSYTSVPVAVIKQTFTNDHSTSNGLFNIELTQQVQNPVTTSWSLNTKWSSSININFVIKKIGIGFNFEQAWGENFAKSETVTLGTKTGLQVTAKPGESIFTELRATKGNLTIEIDYKARLTGRIVAIYSYKNERGQNFSSYDVDEIMRFAGLKNEIVNKLTVNIGFYSDGHIRICDERIGAEKIPQNS